MKDINEYHSCEDELEWYGCYNSDSKYKQYFTKESNAHPAKMAWGLLEKIFDHLREFGMLKEDTTIVDFMAGTARSNIMAALRGYKSIAIELEPHFVEMITGYDCDGKTHTEKEVIEKGWDAHWSIDMDRPFKSVIFNSEYSASYDTEYEAMIRMGICADQLEGKQKEQFLATTKIIFKPAKEDVKKIEHIYRCGTNEPHNPHRVQGNKERCESAMGKKLDMEVIQGDARELSSLLQEKGYAAITSPPYGSSGVTFKRCFRSRYYQGSSAKEVRKGDTGYDSKNLVGLVSTPYNQDQHSRMTGKCQEIFQGRSYKVGKEYSTAKENIGNLKDTPLAGVVSPPYTERHAYPDIERERQRVEKLRMHPDSQIGGVRIHEHESSNPENIGNLKDKPLAAVVSPPYGNAAIGRGIDPHMQGLISKLSGIPVREFAHNPERHKEAVKLAQEKLQKDYSNDPNNIGNLKDKPLTAVVSPPYTQAREGGGLNINPPDTFRGVLKKHSFKEGESEGQIGNLKDKPLAAVVSPPYCKEEHSRTQKQATMREQFKGRSYIEGKEYSENPSNIGNLKDAPIAGITSPPFENSTIKKEFKTEEELEEFARQQYVFKHGRSLEATKRFIEKNWRGYSDSENNLGNHQGESYLSAMLKVYSEGYKSGISPLVVVTKNPTKCGQLRRLDLDTIKLLEMSGYRIVDYHRAILFKEIKHRNSDGTITKIPKGRLSFFKRLAYQKGSPVARWEDIIIAAIPSSEAPRRV